MKICLLLNLGTVEYGKAWQLQRNLFSARVSSKIDDVLVLVQHPPTYTIGRRGDANQLLIPEEELIRQGYSVYKVDRGGAITYHCPGQIVGYPILNIKSYTEGYYDYLRMLEEVMIRTLKELGIYAGRRTEFTGVWVNSDMNAEYGMRNEEHLRSPHSTLRNPHAIRNPQKIGSVGVRIVMGYTMHGFSLNVNNDLSPFSMIIPCNIQDVKMTSICQILGTPVPYKKVEDNIVRQFGNVFGVEIHKWKHVLNEVNGNALTGLEPNYPLEMITER
ncbi:MAG: lipoyl(octanoyl) transferase LipB [Candidatus Brocadiales bacterium]